MHLFCLGFGKRRLLDCKRGLLVARGPFGCKRGTGRTLDEIAYKKKEGYLPLGHEFLVLGAQRLSVAVSVYRTVGRLGLQKIIHPCTGTTLHETLAHFS